jgi:hypothetical protein
MNKTKTKILLWLNSCKPNLKNRRRDSFRMRKLSLGGSNPGNSIKNDIFENYISVEYL